MVVSTTCEVTNIPLATLPLETHHSRTVYNVRMEVVNSSHKLPAKQLANLESRTACGVLSWTSDDFSTRPDEVSPATSASAPQRADGQQQQQHAPQTRQEERMQCQQQQQSQQRASGLQRRASDARHAGISFWPLPPELAGVELCVEVRWGVMLHSRVLPEGVLVSSPYVPFLCIGSGGLQSDWA